MKSTGSGDSQASPETQPSCRGISAVRLCGVVKQHSEMPLVKKAS